MFYNIGISNSYNMNYKPIFRGKEEVATTTNPIEQNSSLRGAQALGVYNSAFIKKNDDKFDIPVTEMIPIPEDLNQVEGEKVYSSDGKLVCIIQDDGINKTVYSNDEDKTITILDSKTGEKLKEQDCYTSINKEIMIAVHDIKNNRGSHYENKDNQIELYSKGKDITLPNGNTMEVIYYCKEKEYQTIERSYFKNTNWLFDESIIYDENKNIKSITKHTNHSDIDTEVNYKDGKAYSVETNTTKSVKNNLGREWEDDTDLIPAERYVVPKNLKEQQGKRTYYSNGNLETLETERGKYFFDYNEQLLKIIEGNKEIEVGDKAQCITEHFGQNKTRETTLYNNNNDLDSYFVRHTNGNIQKEISVVNGKVQEYSNFENNEGFSNIYSSEGSLRTIRPCIFEK